MTHRTISKYIVYQRTCISNNLNKGQGVPSLNSLYILQIKIIKTQQTKIYGMYKKSFLQTQLKVKREIFTFVVHLLKAICDRGRLALQAYGPDIGFDGLNQRTLILFSKCQELSKRTVTTCLVLVTWTGFETLTSHIRSQHPTNCATVVVIAELINY